MTQPTADLPEKEGMPTTQASFAEVGRHCAKRVWGSGQQRFYAQGEETGELSMRDGMVFGSTPARWTSPYKEREKDPVLWGTLFCNFKEFHSLGAI